MTNRAEAAVRAINWPERTFSAYLSQDTSFDSIQAGTSVFAFQSGWEGKVFGIIRAAAKFFDSIQAGANIFGFHRAEREKISVFLKLGRIFSILFDLKRKFSALFVMGREFSVFIRAMAKVLDIIQVGAAVFYTIRAEAKNFENYLSMRRKLAM